MLKIRGSIPGEVRIMEMPPSLAANYPCFAPTAANEKNEKEAFTIGKFFSDLFVF